MLTPTVLPVASPLHAVGSTPAVSLTRFLPQGADADLLLLGCGDVRNILYTAYSEKGFPARKLDITCCDVEDAIIARNVLLLTLLVTEGTTIDSQIFWDAYYHLSLSEEVVLVLVGHVNELLNWSATLDEWRQSRFGGTFRFGDDFTLRSVRRVWSQYAKAFSDKNSEGYRSSFEAALKTSRDYKDATIGKSTVSYGGARVAAPLGMRLMTDPDFKTIMDAWWEQGTTGSRSDTGKIPNPLFAVSLSDNSILHSSSNPILSFHLASAGAHLSDVSPLKLPDAGAEHPSASSLAVAAQLQFSEWVKAFIELPRSNLVIRFIAADAFALCHTLQLHVAGGAASANFYQRQFSSARLELDAAEYVKGGAPSQYDVIDTSNLSDHFGALNLLVSAGPLMKDVPWATLYTETMDKSIDREKSQFEELLCGPTKTISTILGISPAEYWTNATATSHVDEYMLAAVASQRASGQPSMQWRFAWKLNSHLSGHLSSARLHVTEDDVATLIHKVYWGMFPNENLTALRSMSKEQQPESLWKQTYPRYHRGSLVVFSKRLLQVVDVNTESVCKQVLAKIAADSSLIFGSNFLQSLSLQMSVHGLYCEDWLAESIRRGPDAGPLATWADIPQGVFITIVVPKDSWTWVYSAALANRFGFAVEGSMRCVQGGVPVWHNLFADVQIVFGSAEFVGERDSPAFAVSVKEDELGWASESSMIATFYVPSIAVQLDPKNTRVALCVQNSVQNLTKLKAQGKLGQELQISEVELEDRDMVYITENPPGQIGHPCYSSLGPTGPVGVKDAKSSSQCSASLDADGHIIAITSHVDVLSLEGMDMLKNKTEVTVRQTSPFVFEADIGHGTVIHELRFPIPVDGNGSRTRIARTSGYVEVIASPADPETTEMLDDFIFPTTLASTGSTAAEKIPVTLTIPHLNLDTLPVIDASDKQRLSFLTTLASWTFSNRERKVREQTVGSAQGGPAPSARLNFKESLFTMFMLASGLQGGQTGLFAINHPEKGGIHMLLFVSAIRLDGANASVALDAAVIPFTVETIKSGELDSFLLVLRTLECCTVTVDDAELVLWKKVLPALVERCRNWSHTLECEYSQPGASVPLSTEPGKQTICSCGAGKLPENFVALPEWETAARFATRLAISPTYAVPFVEQVVDLETLKGADGAVDASLRCRSCGAGQGKSGGALKKCMRCLRVQYCSVGCQKKDWKKHRMECEEAAPAWEGGK